MFYTKYADDMSLGSLIRYDIFETSSHIQTPITSCKPDIFEAFIGMAVLILDGFNYGQGMFVAQNILYYHLNRTQLSASLQMYTPWSTQFNDIIKSRSLPFTILHKYWYAKQRNEHVEDLLVLQKTKIPKDFQDLYMQNPLRFKNEVGYNVTWNHDDNTDEIDDDIEDVS
jgi:hypothetical protein